MSGGEEGTIAIGVCDADYPEDRMAGWSEWGVGYHADDGGLVHLKITCSQAFKSKQHKKYQPLFSLRIVFIMY